MQQQTKNPKNWSLLKLMKIGVPDALVFSGLFVGLSPLWRRMPGQRRRKVGHENNCAPFCRWWRRLHSLHATFKTPSEQCLKNLMLQHLRSTLWCTEAGYQLPTSSSCSTAVMTHVNLLCWQCSDPLGPASWSGCQTFCWRARCSKLALKGMHCVIRSWRSFSW